MDAGQLMDSLVAGLQPLVDIADGGDWREQPVPFLEFVTSPAHLGLPPLYPLQAEAVQALLGDDPCAIFADPDQAVGRTYQAAVLLWGKGSGKDYLCSIVTCYLIYTLLCLRDPQSYLQLGPGEPIDLVNVAYNADQAKRVFFTKLKERIRRWRWLSDTFDVYEANRPVRPVRPGFRRIDINDSEIVFPGGIRAFSRHAQNESYEGLNVLVWIMDEASAFLSKVRRENADKIHRTLRTSATTRFGRRWLGFIISYPRHADDFTMTRLREAKANPAAGVFGHGPFRTWEVNARMASESWVDARPGYPVPASALADYLEDFQEAQARYECQPPLATEALIRYPEHLDQAVTPGRPALIEYASTVSVRHVIDDDPDDPTVQKRIRREYVGVDITAMRPLPDRARGARIYFHGDPGLVNDSFALVVGHGEPTDQTVQLPAADVYDEQERDDRDLLPTDIVDAVRPGVTCVIDAVIVWRPDPTTGRQVDYLNVGDVLDQIVSFYRLGKGTFDKWNSAETIQRLVARRGAKVEDENWSNPFQLGIYRNARSAFYNHLVDLPDIPEITGTDPRAPGAIHELRRVQLIDGHKIDHPEGGSKDTADALVRVIQHVTESRGPSFAFGTIEANRAPARSVAVPGIL